MPTFSSSPLGMLAAFLCNYALHSTLLLGAAWLLTRRLGGRHAALQEWIWRGALVGGVLSAALQLSLPERSWMFASQPSTTLAATKPVEKKVSPSRTPWLEVGREAELASAKPRPTAMAGAAAASTGTAASVSASARRLGASWVVVPWAILASGLLSLLALRWWSFRRTLSGRRSVLEGHLLSLLDTLADRAGLARRVRLTASERFSVPFARGLAQPEICMPERALTTLAPNHQEGILAHEVAHLVRRDPMWILALRLFEAVFFFQPLNRLASRRLTELAELRCDDWAARATGKGRDLAICLTEVAAWMVGGENRVLAPAMAATRSGLAQRIERLMTYEKQPAEGSGTVRWLLGAGLAALASALLLMPGATLARSEAPAPAPEARVEPARAAEVTPAVAPTPRVRKLSRQQDAVAPDAVAAEDFDRALRGALAPLQALESLEALRDFEVLPALAEWDGHEALARLAELAEVEEWDEVPELAELAELSDLADFSYLAELSDLDLSLAWLDRPPAPPAPPSPPAPPRPVGNAHAPPAPPGASAPPSAPAPPRAPHHARELERRAERLSPEERERLARDLAKRADELSRRREEALSRARADLDRQQARLAERHEQMAKRLAEQSERIERLVEERVKATLDKRRANGEVHRETSERVRVEVSREVERALRDLDRVMAEARRGLERARLQLERSLEAVAPEAEQP